jgi:hypothetical protein
MLFERDRVSVGSKVGSEQTYACFEWNPSQLHPGRGAVKLLVRRRAVSCTSSEYYGL